MIKFHFYKTTCIVLGIVFLISANCSKKPQAESNYNRISSLARSLSYNQILTEFNTYPWDREKDPSMLMIYCEALVESGKSFPSSLESAQLSTYKSEFAKGYFDLLRGELREALIRFVKLTDNTDNKDGQIWGYIGLLEYALYTESISIMKDPLELLKKTVVREPIYIPEWVIPHYSAYYHFYSGNFSEVNKILREHSRQLDQIVAADLKVNLLIEDNRLEEANKVINNLPSNLRNDQNVIALEADIIGLKYGPDHQMKYLSEKYKRFPRMWAIEQRYAHALIEAGKSQHGIDLLKKLAQKRPHDLMIKLDLAETLLFYGNSEEIKKEIKNLFLQMQNNSNYIQLPYYNILLAEIYHRQGEEEKAQKHLKIAMELYPQNPRLLWLKRGKYLK